MAEKNKKVAATQEEETKKTRIFRSKETRLQEVEKKLKYHRDCIQILEQKKAAIIRGRSGGTGRTKTLKRLIADAKLNDTELIEVMSMGDEEKIRARLNEIIEEKKTQGETTTE